jgi:hypothetical protein|nr:MAG TPA: hypothetical protein [Caudoviricetes sp.]
MKIKDFARVKTVRSNDVFITDGDRGTKTILADDLVFALLTGSPEMHKNIIRGRNLGVRITSDQHKAITSGTFEGLWLGDYWFNNNMAWRIVDFNYWNVNNALPTPHIVVMPDRPLYRQQMYDTTASSTNSFWGSKVWQNINGCDDYVIRVFDSNTVRTHVDSYQSQMNEGAGFVPPTIKSKSLDPRVKYIIPNEIMIYGTRIAATSGIGSDGLHEVSSRQLQLFAMGWNPGDSDFWLRDQTYINTYSVYGAEASNIGGGSTVRFSGDGVQNETHGVRPVFAIG